MREAFQRSELLLGESAIDKMVDSNVAIFGIGGVGSYAAEILVRTGLGKISLIDYDKIDITNINRQIHATSRTIGKYKVDVMKDRLLEINPEIEVTTFKTKFNEENIDKINFNKYDYVVDAIDMISSKILLIETCKNNNIPIISAMGAGNKLSPLDFKVGDIYETKVCPLARVMRRELRKRKISDLKVIWSEEKPENHNLQRDEIRKSIPASIAFVPSVAGIIMASEVIKDLTWEE